MTIAELKEIINKYPDDQFVHIRIWFLGGFLQGIHTQEINKDIIVDKTQQGVSGSLLITGHINL